MIKLALAGHQLVVKDYFTPFNEKELEAKDKDLGSGGPLLLPDQPGPHPQLLVVSGKGGTLYVLDRDRLGKHLVGSDSQIVQTLPGGPDENFGASAYWNGHVFCIFAADVPKDFAVTNGLLSSEPARGSRKFPDPGCTPTISANGMKERYCLGSYLQALERSRREACGAFCLRRHCPYSRAL